MNRVIHGSNEQYRLIRKIGEGGQGSVWEVEKASDGKKMALKWYKKRFATPVREKILRSLIDQGPPPSPHPDILYIWPLDLVRDPSIPGFGYVMELFDSGQFLSLNELIHDITSEKRKDLPVETLARLSYLMVQAFDSLHAQGYAYCDISPGNVVFDPDNRRVAICDNDNVVLNWNQVDVIGTPEYMAPEVALGKTPPNMQSDLHSIAVVLYELWTWLHPFWGAQTEKVRSWDLPAIRRYYAESPIFHHHPFDPRNRIDGIAELTIHRLRWEELCPERLKQLFIRAFTTGVTNPDIRPRLIEWKQAFLEMEANAVICSCGAHNIVDLDVTASRCFHCQQPLPDRAYLDFRTPTRSRLALRPGAEIRAHHLGRLDPHKAHQVIGRVEPHPHKSNALILRNLSQTPWTYRANNKELIIEPQKARPIVAGGEIRIQDVSVWVRRKGE